MFGGTVSTCSVAQVTQAFYNTFFGHCSGSVYQLFSIAMVFDFSWITFSFMGTLQAVKDWHLTTAVMVISAVIFLMSILSAAVTPLRPDLRLRPDVERPSGVTVCELQVLLQPLRKMSLKKVSLRTLYSVLDQSVWAGSLYVPNAHSSFAYGRNTPTVVPS